MEKDIKQLLLGSFNKYMIRTGQEAEIMRVAAYIDPTTHYLLSPDDQKFVEVFLLKQVISSFCLIKIKSSL